MKITLYIKWSRIWLLLLAGVVLLLADSCTSDEKGEDITGGTAYPVSFVFETKASDPNANDAEGMKNLLLFFVNTQNKVEEIVRLPFQSHQEEETVNISLTPGQKTVYAFANLDEDQIQELNSLNKNDTWLALANKTYSIENGKTLDDVKNGTFLLPMSNSKVIEVQEKQGQVFYMEVIRLVSKIELTFENQTNDIVKVNRFEISPVTGSNIFLLPDWNIPGVPSFPAARLTTTFSKTYSAFELGAKGSAAAEKGDTPFYLNESVVLPGDKYGFFYVKLQTNEGGNDKVREAILDRTYLCRNDFLKLPIVLFNYILELEVKAYPPIGGYPADVTPVIQADTYTCTFDTGGPFIIRPELKDKNGNEIATTAVSWNFHYEGTSSADFFVKEPLLKNGEITGEIAARASGTAECTISVEINVKPSSGGALRELRDYKIIFKRN